MITRREFLLGGLVTMLWSAAPCGCALADDSDPLANHAGCVLEGQIAEYALNLSTPPQTVMRVSRAPKGKAPKASESLSDKPIVRSSGNRELDFALAQTLSRLTDLFQVLPGFAFYDDKGSPNAFATSKVRLARTDGTVLFGLEHLKRKLAFREAPDAAVAATCAHEYGHILQNKLKLRQKLLDGQPTVKRNELHADFLAGYYAGRQKLRRPDFAAAVFATTRGGGYNTQSKDHHGTPEERAAAVVRGFETAYRQRHTLNDAIQIGVNYVMKL